MSQENVASYRRVVDAWNRGDLDDLLALFDDDIEVFSRLVVMEGGYRGHDGVRRWWGNLHDAFPDWHVEPLKVRAIKDATLARLRLRGHGGESGAPVDEEMWHLAHWRDGRIVRLSSHDSEAEALEAAGLRE
jgi:ketosteroid isomerase-like protein